MSDDAVIAYVKDGMATGKSQNAMAKELAARGVTQAQAERIKAKYEQETASFDKTMDSFKKLVIVEKSMKPRRDEKGYVMMGVKEFLLDKDSLEA